MKNERLMGKNQIEKFKKKNIASNTNKVELKIRYCFTL